MKVGVIGSGSWGTALANVLADNGQEVLVWGRELSEVNDLKQHKNERYFPSVVLNKSLMATDDIGTLSDSDVILLAVPSKAIESIAMVLNELLEKKVIVINVAKGFHPDTHELMSELITRVIDASKLEAVVNLIGPSHAEEVVLRKVTLLNAVSDSEKAAIAIQKLFSNDYFRVYTNDDVIGSQVGVALKNIIAFASGIASGLDLGDNARAALITRGLAEMTRYGVLLGGRAETFLGLCGVGDLVVTASSPHSRNFTAGFRVGEMDSVAEFFETTTTTVEGVFAAKVVYDVAIEKGINMPITTEVYKIVYEGKTPSKAIKDLMNRALKPE